jgi:hypothetical protein
MVVICLAVGVGGLLSLVDNIGWERLRHRSPCPAHVPAKAGQRLSPLLGG